MRVLKHFRNSGKSFGLEFPYIYGFACKDDGKVRIWHRKTGKVVWESKGKNEAWDEGQAMKECLRLNELTF